MQFLQRGPIHRRQWRSWGRDEANRPHNSSCPCSSQDFLAWKAPQAHPKPMPCEPFLPCSSSTGGSRIHDAGSVRDPQDALEPLQDVPIMPIPPGRGRMLNHDTTAALSPLLRRTSFSSVHAWPPLLDALVCGRTIAPVCRACTDPSVQAGDWARLWRRSE